MKIENTEECMAWLWRLLVKTQRVLKESHRRFCPLNVLKLWHEERLFSAKAVEGGMDDAYFEVCHLAELEGYEQLRRISLYPRKHRELLRAVVAVSCGIGIRQVDTKALDHAYSLVFPHATPINVRKIRRQ